MLPQVQTEDILEFGMIPEFVGRLPVISSLAPLDDAGLVRVLTEPKNALLKQYQTLFEMEDCQLEFTRERPARDRRPRPSTRAPAPAACGRSSRTS